MSYVAMGTNSSREVSGGYTITEPQNFAAVKQSVLEACHRGLASGRVQEIIADLSDDEGTWHSGRVHGRVQQVREHAKRQGFDIEAPRYATKNADRTLVIQFKVLGRRPLTADA